MWGGKVMEEFFNRTDKKYKIIMLCVIVCIIIVAYIGSQLHDDNHLIVGRWEEVGDCWMDELEFFSDGTYSSDKDNYFGSYTIEDGRIRLGGVLMSDLVYSYKLDGDTLILYEDDDDDGIEYRRVDWGE